MERNDKGKGKQKPPSGTPIPHHFNLAEMNAAEEAYEQRCDNRAETSSDDDVGEVVDWPNWREPPFDEMFPPQARLPGDRFRTAR